MVDIVETDGEIHVVVELPGVEKTDIKLHGTEDSLTISVDTLSSTSTTRKLNCQLKCEL